MYKLFYKTTYKRYQNDSKQPNYTPWRNNTDPHGPTWDHIKKCYLHSFGTGN